MRADADDIETYVLKGYPGLSISEHFYTVPLDYTKPDGHEITIFARIVKKHEVPVKPKKKDEEKKDDSKKQDDEEKEDGAYRIE
ncbi:hypothetical protein ABW20_dc0101400 [Dactylellina cionopaga]|nr:hypothetical protein ABW20_dc0101400 [Dactylellina cionopaga]